LGAPLVCLVPWLQPRRWAKASVSDSPSALLAGRILIWAQLVCFTGRGYRDARSGLIHLRSWQSFSCCKRQPSGRIIDRCYGIWSIRPFSIERANSIRSTAVALTSELKAGFDWFILRELGARRIPTFTAALSTAQKQTFRFRPILLKNSEIERFLKRSQCRLRRMYADCWCRKSAVMVRRHLDVSRRGSSRPFLPDAYWTVKIQD